MNRRRSEDALYFWGFQSRSGPPPLRDSHLSVVASPLNSRSNALFRAFRGLRPGLKATFSAARYGPGHWIDPHDDRQYRDVFGVRYSRDVALVYYLNQDWSPVRRGREGRSLLRVTTLASVDGCCFVK